MAHSDFLLLSKMDMAAALLAVTRLRCVKGHAYCYYLGTFRDCLLSDSSAPVASHISGKRTL